VLSGQESRSRTYSNQSFFLLLNYLYRVCIHQLRSTTWYCVVDLVGCEHVSSRTKRTSEIRPTLYSSANAVNTKTIYTLFNRIPTVPTPRLVLYENIDQILPNKYMDHCIKNRCYMCIQWTCVLYSVVIHLFYNSTVRVMSSRVSMFV